MRLPINPNITKAYRDTLLVPSSPSYIETDVPPMPVVVVNAASAPALNASVERGISSIKTTSGSPGTGTITRSFLVPGGRKWTLKSLYAGSAATLTGIAYQITDGTNTIIIKDFSSGLGNTYYQAPTNLTLSQGWSVQIVFSNITVDGNCISTILIQDFEEAQ